LQQLLQKKLLAQEEKRQLIEVAVMALQAMAEWALPLPRFGL
jgi:hypothetical protein